MRWAAEKGSFSPARRTGVTVISNPQPARVFHGNTLGMMDIYARNVVVKLIQYQGD
jgi:hypothetical protein